MRTFLERGLDGKLQSGQAFALKLEAVPRRNRNWRVTAPDGTGLFLKQGFEAEGAHTVSREARIYAMLASTRARPAIRERIPRIVGYDEDWGVLVLELVHRGRSLERAQVERREFPTQPAALLGAALGALHAFRLRPGDDIGTTHPPPVLSYHRPGVDVFRRYSHANLEMLKLMQRHPALGEQLDALRDPWPKTTLIHCDVKADNVLISPASSARHALDLHIVDWELAHRSDPAWDVGCALADYLAYWVFSIPFQAGSALDATVARARHPLPLLQAASRAVWEAYARERKLTASNARALLERAMRLSAARLLQLAFGRGQLQTRMNLATVYAVQLAHNILSRPDDAATRLLALNHTIPEAHA